MYKIQLWPGLVQKEGVNQNVDTYKETELVYDSRHDLNGILTMYKIM
jgi:hypothetical protein